MSKVLTSLLFLHLTSTARRLTLVHCTLVLIQDSNCFFPEGKTYLREAAFAPGTETLLILLHKVKG